VDRILTEKTGTEYELCEGRKRIKHSRPMDSVNLSSDKPRGFLAFLAYVPVLIFALTLGLWLWLLQSTINKDPETIQKSPHCAAGELIRVAIRRDTFPRPRPEFKVPKTSLEQQTTPELRQINALGGNATSVDSGLIAGKKKSHAKNKIYWHEVQNGETLYRIARKYSLTVKQLLATNNLNEKNRIYPGQKILIIRNTGRINSHSDYWSQFASTMDLSKGE
jgi:LysM repeat protein